MYKKPRFKLKELKDIPLYIINQRNIINTKSLIEKQRNLITLYSKIGDNKKYQASSILLEKHISYLVELLQDTKDIEKVLKETNNKIKRKKIAYDRNQKKLLERAANGDPLIKVCERCGAFYSIAKTKNTRTGETVKGNNTKICKLCKKEVKSNE